MHDNTLQTLLLDQLIPSPTNPRKTFDPVALDELAASIREKGLIQPIVVRPHHNGRGAEVDLALYEVVAGERRYRASRLAELGEVMCIVRDLDDVAVLEIQTIENLQRDDLHPLEEAQGFAALMKSAGYDVERIAKRIGRSGKYVYDRVKLLQLVPELRTVFLEGEITAGHAILLARLSPADQKRAIGSGIHDSGLFLHDHGTQDELDLDDVDDETHDRISRKPKSVRELAAWIRDQVRFRPEEVDLPNLFPETAATLASAEEEELKVVHITREYRVSDGARDKQRTYGVQSWKRADGKPEREHFWSTKTYTSVECEHSVMGVVVAGPGRGEAFKVCVNKKKCDVHWKREREEKAKRKAGASGTDPYADRQRKWEEERRKAEAERARWKKAAPRLLEELATKVSETPALELVDIVLEDVRGDRKAKGIERGKTIEDAIRYAAFQILAQAITWEWGAPGNAPKALKRVGINAKKIVNEVAPKERKKRPAKPKAKRKPAAKKTKKKPARKRASKKSADVSKGSPR